jgi:hypothetical protein
MIVSHKHRFIFIKTTKTAGTSIEISLSRFCGPDDIITPISAQDEAIRRELDLHPQNYENYQRTLEPLEYRLGDIKTLITEGKIPTVTTNFWNHIPARKIKRGLNPSIWNNYYKFCFVRNPWDRAVSRYYWNQEKTGEAESLDDSLKNNDPNSNYDIYTIKDRIAVDYVAKFENLIDELNFICQKLNIPFDGWLPRAKGNVRKDKRHYSELLNDEQAEYIRQKCQQEIQWFNYQFEKK